jgi:hypothetical protein
MTARARIIHVEITCRTYLRSADPQQRALAMSRAQLKHDHSVKFSLQ